MTVQYTFDLIVIPHSSAAIGSFTFFVTVLLIIVVSARSYSNTSKTLFEKALEKNKELPEELQDSVSDIIRAFPQAEPLDYPAVHCAP